MSFPGTAARTGRPAAAGLLAEQLRHTVVDLWRVRVVFVFTFLFPLTWLVVIGFLAGNATVDEDSGVRVMQFVTPTAVVMGVLYAAWPTVATALATAREQGVLKRVRGTPLPAWIYLAGRVGGAVVFALCSVLTMLIVGALAYDVQILWRTAPATVVTIAVGIACFAALGLAVAALSPSAAVAEAVSIAGAVALGFLSGLFIVGDLPGWVDSIAAVFPLKPFNEALQGQFDPFASGGGWDPGALAVMAAWTLAASLVAVRAFGWDPARGGTGRAPAPAVASRRDRAVDADAPGRPSTARLVLGQVGWATRAAARDPGWVFFAVALPVGLYAFIMAVLPDGAAADGVPPELSSAAGMAAWGAAVTAFVNMPEAVVRARDRGVLKRLRGTPLGPVGFMAGHTVSTLWIALVTAVLVVAVGVVFFGLVLTWPGVFLAAAVVVLGTATLAACGFALAAVLPSSKAVSAVGLAILLPLAFFSDIFFLGDTPGWMQTVGSVFPLKHFSNSLAAALDPSGSRILWGALAVMAAWLVAAALVATRTFRWGPRAEHGAPSAAPLGLRRRGSGYARNSARR
ncbi:ABC transporter permease [Rhodococcus ruber]